MRILVTDTVLHFIQRLHNDRFAVHSIITIPQINEIFRAERNKLTKINIKFNRNLYVIIYYLFVKYKLQFDGKKANYIIFLIKNFIIISLPGQPDKII